MSLPIHSNLIDADRLATAPYNFIPQPDRVIVDVSSADELPRHDSYGNPNYPYTGYFDVTLTTKSPLYVRGLMTMADFLQEDNEADHTGFRDRIKNRPAFFHTTTKEQPVIPGSSLRGMLRSFLEIVSYGKLERVTNKNLIYRAVGDTTSLGSWYREQTLGANKAAGGGKMRFAYPSSQLRGGYLKRVASGWHIVPARSYHGESFVHVEYKAANIVIGGSGRHRTHDVLVTPAPRTTPPRSRPSLILELAVTHSISHIVNPIPGGMVRAALVESGHMGGASSKHMHCAIYEKDAGAATIPIDTAMWNAYEDDRDMQRGIWPRELGHNGDPLFYLLDAKGKLIFFGPTMMFRLPYKRSLHDLIPGYTRNRLQIDYADALFGYTRDPKAFQENGQLPPPQGHPARAYAGRVSVTDAVLATDVDPQRLWLTHSNEGAIPLSILSTPKPTSFQNYLVQPRAERPDLSHYDSPQKDSNGVEKGYASVLRGFKRYWHQGSRSPSDLRPTPNSPNADAQGNPNPNSKLHTVCNPVQKDVAFTFRVCFENLSARELGALCWTLHPVGEAAKTYCHSMGMGKPLGMGAVCLDATLHLTNRELRYKRLFSDDKWESGEQNSEGEAMAVRTLLEKRVQSFEEHMLAELKPLFPDGRTCMRLAEVKRIGMLLTMLEWQDKPVPERARSMGFENRTRPVLPDPSRYASEVNLLATPTSSRNIPGNDHKQIDNEGTSAKTSPDAHNLKMIRDNTSAIRNKGDVSRAEGIVRLIAALETKETKRQCAQDLQQKLQRYGAWNKPPHNMRPWYKQLEGWLD